jgi:recombination protein RecA
MATKKISEADIWKDMQKTFAGGGESNMFDRDNAPDVDVISTGCPAVDEATGVWGLPRGRIIQFAGVKSSGKTLLSLCTIASAQKQFPNSTAVFIDAEFTFDFKWAKLLGVDTDPSRLKVIKENNAVKVFEGLVGRPKTGKNAKPGEKSVLGLLDHALAGSLNICIVVLDSVARLQPPMEEGSAVGKHNIALLPRFLGPELRKLTPMLERTKIPMIFINQVRVEPGKMFGDPETSPGGSALKHDLSMMIHVAAIDKKVSKIFDKKENQIGHRVRVRIDKNKVGPPFQKTEFDLMYKRGIVNKNVQVAQLGIDYGVIERPNNTSYILGDQKFVGRSKLDAFLKDPTEYSRLLEELKITEKPEDFDSSLEDEDEIVQEDE